jgi:hypothetical protein
MALALSGCPPVPPVTLPLSNRPVIDVRSPDHPEKASEASYAYVVFAYRPSSTNPEDVRLCHAVVGGLLDRDPSAGRVAATYWPTKSYVQPLGVNCDRLLDEYDIDFAFRLRDALPGAKRWEVFLYAQAPSRFGGAPADTSVCVDLTRTRSDNQLRPAMLDWQNLMKGGSETWRPSGFAYRVFQWLTFFRQRGDVHVDCKG